MISREEFGRRFREGYATSHAALDADEAVQEEVRNAPPALARTIRALRAGWDPRPEGALREPRPR